MSPEDEEKAVLGLLVVLLRGLRHGSQAELARASGVQKSQISVYELGKTLPSEATLRRLAAAAGITWAEVSTVLPALRALYRLATRPADRRPAFPGARRTSAAVGRAAAGAFRRQVLPFLRDLLPAAPGSTGWKTGAADAVGRLAADLVPLTVGPVVAERLPALAGPAGRPGG